MTARKCDRCGSSVVDVVGERQASLFDLPDAEPLATPEALAELRAGRVLCPACQRTDDLPGMQEAEAAEIVQAEIDMDVPPRSYDWVDGQCVRVSK